MEENNNQQAAVQPAANNNKVIVARDEYKGHALLVLKPQNPHPKDKGLRFGLKKAQLIIAAIDEIKAFVDEKVAEQG